MAQSHVDIGVWNGDAEVLQLFERMCREWQVREQQTGECETEHNQTRYAIGSGDTPNSCPGSPLRCGHYAPCLAADIVQPHGKRRMRKHA